MKCPFCQTEYYDGLTNCPTCGAAKPDTQQNTQANTAYAQTTARYPTAVEIIKRIGTGKLYLIATILYSVYCALNMLYNQQLPVLELITAIGLWLFFAECKKQSNDPYSMTVSPLQLLRVIETIKYVACWIAAVALALLFPLLFAVKKEMESEFAGFASIIQYLIIILVFLLLIIISQIIIRRGTTNYLKSAIESAKTGLRPKKMSGFYPRFWIGYTIATIVLIIGLALYITSVLDKLTDFISQNMAAIQRYGFVIDTSMYEITDTTDNSSSLLSLALSVVQYASTIVIALTLLDAKKICDSSYYPTQEELFYERHAYFASANPYAQPYGQQPYGQYPYGQQPYGQQPPQYQPPQQQPPQQPPQSSEADTTPTDTDSTK